MEMQVANETAAKLMQNGEYKEAATTLRSALEKARQPVLLMSPDFHKIIGHTLCMQAECFLEMNNLEHAEEDIRHARSQFNEEPAEYVAYLKARVSEIHGEVVDAFIHAITFKALDHQMKRDETVFDRIKHKIRVKTQNASFAKAVHEDLLKYATDTFEAKEYRIAQCVLTEILELFPVLPDVLRFRAKCYMNMDEYDKANNDCDRVLQLTDRKCVESLSMKAEIQHLNGSVNETLSLIQEWRKLDPQNEAAKFKENELMQIFEQMGATESTEPGIQLPNENVPPEVSHPKEEEAVLHKLPTENVPPGVSSRKETEAVPNKLPTENGPPEVSHQKETEAVPYKLPTENAPPEVLHRKDTEPVPYKLPTENVPSEVFHRKETEAVPHKAKPRTSYSRKSLILQEQRQNKKMLKQKRKREEQELENESVTEDCERKDTLEREVEKEIASCINKSVTNCKSNCAGSSSKKKDKRNTNGEKSKIDGGKCAGKTGGIKQDTNLGNGRGSGKRKDDDDVCSNKKGSCGLETSVGDSSVSGRSGGKKGNVHGNGSGGTKGSFDRIGSGGKKGKNDGNESSGGSRNRNGGSSGKKGSGGGSDSGSGKGSKKENCGGSGSDGIKKSGSGSGSGGKKESVDGSGSGGNKEHGGRSRSGCKKGSFDGSGSSDKKGKNDGNASSGRSRSINGGSSGKKGSGGGNDSGSGKGGKKENCGGSGSDGIKESGGGCGSDGKKGISGRSDGNMRSTNENGGKKENCGGRGNGGEKGSDTGSGNDLKKTSDKEGRNEIEISVPNFSCSNTRPNSPYKEDTSDDGWTVVKRNKKKQTRESSNRVKEDRNRASNQKNLGCGLSDSRSSISTEPVFIDICNHFLQKYRHKQLLSGSEGKICNHCAKDKTEVKKAFWDKVRSKWEAVRPRPDNVYGSYKLCRHFMQGRPCARHPCTFAHGEIEQLAWTEERKKNKKRDFRQFSSSKNQTEKDDGSDVTIVPSPSTNVEEERDEAQDLEFYHKNFPKLESQKQRSESPDEIIDFRYWHENLKGSHRPPPMPQNIPGGTYNLCQSKARGRICIFGTKCVFAHSEQELQEWRDHIKKMRTKYSTLVKTTTKEIKRKQYQTKDLVEAFDGVVVTTNPDERKAAIKVETDRKKHTHEWTISIQYQEDQTGHLRHVSLTHLYHTTYSLSSVSIETTSSTYSFYKQLNTERFKLPRLSNTTGHGTITVETTISFNSEARGSFPQSVVFDFGKAPYLVVKLHVDVHSEMFLEKLTTERTKLTMDWQPWNDAKMKIVEFEPKPASDALNVEILKKYPLPERPEVIYPTELLDKEKGLTPDNYRRVMHSLLFVEETFMQKEIGRFNDAGKMKVSKTVTGTFGLKQSREKEMFGTISLPFPITPDHVAGRLLSRNVSGGKILVRPRNYLENIAYEALINFLENEVVIVMLSSQFCEMCQLSDGSEFDVDVQFQINRQALCEMHDAIDRLSNHHIQHILLPTAYETNTRGKIQLRAMDEKNLNEKQKMAIKAIVTSSNTFAPLVIFGPFGTGKTHTLSHAVRRLILDTNNRVLLCTHTNSAADLHVMLLNEYLKTPNSIKNCKPLRICAPVRNLQTVGEDVLHYCLIGDNGNFVLPTHDDAIKHRVIITTLSMSRALFDQGFQRGFFSHILIDESAQALEPEILIPLTLAGNKTKVVFTGDHMQMSPDVFSDQARELGLKTSLIERLIFPYKTDDHISDSSNLIVLHQNYRSHPDILSFPSEVFYEGMLEAASNPLQPRHPQISPLSFYSVTGSEKFEQNLGSYRNFAEVYEVVSIVKRISSTWPNEWGVYDPSQICVVAPYYYQVITIRDVLRSQNLSKISVETMQNVQGKQFRVFIISTVRTYQYCKEVQTCNTGSSQKPYFEFLSDPKLLNTAITRAQSLVAVIGDALSLCTMGECQALWKEFIDKCDKLGGLFGTTKEVLEDDIAKNGLNVKAEEFVPSWLKFESTEIDAKDEKKDVSGNTQANTNHGISQGEALFVDQTKSESTSKDANKNTTDLTCHSSERFIEDTPTEETSNYDNCNSSNSYSDRNRDSTPKDGIQRNNELLYKLLLDESKHPKVYDSLMNALATLSKENPEQETVHEIKDGQEVGKTARQHDIVHQDVAIVTRKRQLEIDILNCFYRDRRYTERSRRLINSSRDDSSLQEHLDPEYLIQKLVKEPNNYKKCFFRSTYEKTKKAFGEVYDTTTKDIIIRGWVKQVFHGDVVVVELNRNETVINTELQGPSQITAKLVGVLRHLINPRERKFVCMIGPENIAVMIPINKSIPVFINFTSSGKIKGVPIWYAVENEQEPLIHGQIMEEEEARSGENLFVVQYLKWETSHSTPLGIVINTIPTGKSLCNALEVLYIEHGIKKNFDENTENEVKQKYPTEWKIPDQERRQRETITNAFTIDPPDAKDLDDALSVEKVNDDTFRVGVHIADVSYFVKPGTDIDIEARSRCTSYYQGHGRPIPMLPPELSENLCSLLPGKDRLTVTVFLDVDCNGMLKQGCSPIFKRSITHSCCKITYSEAQDVILERDVSSTGIPSNVIDDIQVLNRIAQSRRKQRLQEAFHNHYSQADQGRDFEAHELVEEFMILANQKVAEHIYSKFPQNTPVRAQLGPKEYRVQEWQDRFRNCVRNSLYLARLQNDLVDKNVLKENCDEEEKNEEDVVLLHPNVMERIFNAMKSRDWRSVHALVCNDKNHPQLAAATAHLKRIQQKARYISTGECDETSHYSLGLSKYTHFTSPIRRYIDILVHRLLLHTVGSVDFPRPTEEEVIDICFRCTFASANSQTFEREVKRVHFAAHLKSVSQETTAFVESIEGHLLKIQTAETTDEDLPHRQSELRISHLAPTKQPEFDERKTQITMKWVLRLYLAPSNATLDPGGKSFIEQNAFEVEEKQFLKDHRILKDFLPADAKRMRCFYDKIPSESWQMLLKEIVSEDIREQERIIRMIYDENKSHKHFPHSWQKTLKGIGENSADKCECHYYDTALLLRTYDEISVQLTASVFRGVITPDIQMFYLTPKISLCVEHHKYPRTCFATTAMHPASRTKYANIEDYANAWIPVLAIEAARDAVGADDGFTILDVAVTWLKTNKKVSGSFNLTEAYCKCRHIEFSDGDFACVRVSYKTDKEDENDDDCTSSAAISSTRHTTVQPSKALQSVWVGHCVAQVKEKKDPEPIINVKLTLHQHSSDVPDEIFNNRSTKTTVEVIRRTLPHRRMYTTLQKLRKKPSSFVKSICCGPRNELYEQVDHPLENLLDLSISSRFDSSGLKPLNEYQKEAVKRALSQRLSLIQGPPGTGKTVTGVHIAYWFVQNNKRNPTMSGTDTPKRALPQVLYCGPSNKAVDVVAEYLLKIPGLKILRVYGKRVEENEFPIPNSLEPRRKTQSKSELVSSEKLRSVALHHVIRSPGNRFSAELRKLELKFNNMKKRGESVKDADVVRYKQLISDACSWVVKETGVQIILCTCTTAGKHMIRKLCDNFTHCIIDECGMCMEPESLTPIVSSGVEHVVLIGDHKQLQPIVHDQQAKKLKLDVSLFERLSRDAYMLRKQYRMHQAICEFPSEQFYDGKLETAEEVNRREQENPSPVNFWPGGKHLPIVFCHVEGEEEALVVTGEEGNEESKSNEKEQKKAIDVAKLLVRFGICQEKVVILSPYRHQCHGIREKLKLDKLTIKVMSVVKSQGSEWDYVILSLVRSLPKEEIDPEPSPKWLQENLGFLTDEHLMNVALTRAKRGLCIIGNKDLLGLYEMWSDLLRFYRERNCLVNSSTWPAMHLI